MWEVSMWEERRPGTSGRQELLATLANSGAPVLFFLARRVSPGSWCVGGCRERPTESSPEESLEGSGRASGGPEPSKNVGTARIQDESLWHRGFEGDARASCEAGAGSEPKTRRAHGPATPPRRAFHAVLQCLDDVTESQRAGQGGKEWKGGRDERIEAGGAKAGEARALHGHFHPDAPRVRFGQSAISRSSSRDASPEGRTRRDEDARSGIRVVGGGRGGLAARGRSRLARRGSSAPVTDRQASRFVLGDRLPLPRPT